MSLYKKALAQQQGSQNTGPVYKKALENTAPAFQSNDFTLPTIQDNRSTSTKPPQPTINIPSFAQQQASGANKFAVIPPELLKKGQEVDKNLKVEKNKGLYGKYADFVGKALDSVTVKPINAWVKNVPFDETFSLFKEYYTNPHMKQAQREIEWQTIRDTGRASMMFLRSIPKALATGVIVGNRLYKKANKLNPIGFFGPQMKIPGQQAEKFGDFLSNQAEKAYESLSQMDERSMEKMFAYSPDGQGTSPFDPRVATTMAVPAAGSILLSIGTANSLMWVGLAKGLATTASGLGLGWLEGSEMYHESQKWIHQNQPDLDPDQVKDKAMTLAIINAVGIAALEKAGLDAIFAANAQYPQSFLRRRAVNVMTETMQETAQTIWSNAVEKFGYNSEKELTEDILQTILVTIPTTFFISGAADVLAKLIPQSEESKEAQKRYEEWKSGIMEDVGNQLREQFAQRLKENKEKTAAKQTEKVQQSIARPPQEQTTPETPAPTPQAQQEEAFDVEALINEVTGTALPEIQRLIQDGKNIEQERVSAIENIKQDATEIFVDQSPNDGLDFLNKLEAELNALETNPNQLYEQIAKEQEEAQAFITETEQSLAEFNKTRRDESRDEAQMGQPIDDLVAQAVAETQTPEAQTQTQTPQSQETQAQEMLEKMKEEQKPRVIQQLSEDGTPLDTRTVTFTTTPAGTKRVEVTNSKGDLIEMIDLAKAREKYQSDNWDVIAERIVNGKFDNKTETWDVIKSKESIDKKVESSTIKDNDTTKQQTSDDTRGDVRSKGLSDSDTKIQGESTSLDTTSAISSRLDVSGESGTSDIESGIRPSAYRGKIVSDQIKALESQVLETYRNSEEVGDGFTKADQAFSNIMGGLEMAEAGTRILLGYGKDTEMLGVKSTFPSWIPEASRTRTDLDYLMETITDIQDIKYPEKANETKRREFVDAFLEVLDQWSDTNTSQFRSQIMKLYNENQESIAEYRKTQRKSQSITRRTQNEQQQQKEEEIVQDLVEAQEARNYTNEEIIEYANLHTYEESGQIFVKDGFKMAEGDRQMLLSYIPKGGREKQGATGRQLLDEYFTPDSVVEMTYDALSALGVNFQNKAILEPSLGIGAYISQVPANNAQITGFELTPETARIAKLLYPNAEVFNQPFESMFIDDRGNKKKFEQAYDLVVGNPPYGKHRGMYKGLGEEKDIQAYEDYFIKRSLDVTKEGGYVALVVPSGFLRKGKSKGKEAISKLGDLVVSYRLPNGTFDTTEIGTDLLIFQRNTTDTAEAIKARTETISNDGFHVDTDGLYILGTQKERTGQFGPEMFVEGTLEQAFDEFARVKYQEAAEQITDDTEQQGQIEQEMEQDTYKPDVYAENYKKQAELDKKDTLPENPLAVDPNQTFYHGTTQQFDNFSLEMAGSNTGWSNANFGIFFLENKEQTQQFVKDNAVGDTEVFVKEARLNLKNPLDLTLDGVFNNEAQAPLIVEIMQDEKLTPAEALEWLSENIDLGTIEEMYEAIYSMPENKAKIQEAGYDGIISQYGTAQDGTQIKEYVVFDPSQIDMGPKKAEQKTTKIKPDPKVTQESTKKTAEIMDLSQTTQEADPNWQYVTATGVLEGDFNKDAAYLYKGDYYNKFSYLAGNIYEKLDQLQLEQGITPEQKAKQEKELKAILPEPVTVDRISIPPNSRFLESVKLSNNLNLKTNFEAFIRELPYNAFGRSSSWDVKAYIAGTPVRGNDKIQNAIARTERRIVADNLFKKFITEVLEKDDQKRVVDMYNRRFNAVHLPDYSKVPLTAKLHATFKGKPFELRGHQKQGVGFLVNKGVGLLAHDVGLGKDQPLYSKILTPSGWVTMGQIQQGDSVITKNGTPAKVTGVFPQGLKPVYKITFSDGVSTECGEEHLWSVQTPNKRAKYKDQWLTKTTKQLIESGLYNSRGDALYSIPVVEPVDMKTQVVPLDPYVLGVFIGDGCISNNICISNPEQEIIEKVKSLLPETVQMKQVTTDSIDWNVTGTEHGKNEVLDIFRTLNLFGKHSNSKFIPRIYLDNSKANRIALLQGLMDTDGYADKKSKVVQYTTVSKQLKNDIIELIWSLGGTVRESSKIPTYTYKGEKRIGQLAYTLTLCLPNDVEPFSLRRKAKVVQKRTKYFPVRYITSIDFVKETETQCIMVDDPTHTYVTDNFIVTHNTTAGIIAIAEMLERGWAKKPLIILPSSSVYQQWVAEITEVIPNIKINLLSNLGGDFKGDINNLSIEDGTVSVITEEGFKKLGFKDETYDDLTQDVRDAISMPNEMKTARAKEAADGKVTEVIGKGKKKTTTAAFFEDLGFDHITIDEVHNANHIIGTAKADDGKTSEFSRGFQLKPSEYGIKTWLASQYVLKNNQNRNVFLLSATPFTNHPLEYYSILSLMARARLKEMGIFNVDDFMSVFMDVQSQFEFKANGTYVEKNDVRGFKNYQQLTTLLTEFIDFKDGVEVGIIRPEKQMQAHIVKESQAQIENRIKAQELFNDPKAGNLKAIGELRQNAFSPYASQWSTGTPTAKQFVEGSPKIKLTVDLIAQNYRDNPNANQIIYSPVGVEYFPLIKQYLVDTGVFNSKQVEIIAGATSKANRQKYQEQFNKGNIKLIIGSDSIQEGINLQVKTTDLYILSQPWNFTSLRQVVGRLWRYGNEYMNVRINNMFTENSIDIFLSQKLQNKEARYNALQEFKGDYVDISDIDFNELKLDLLTDPVQKAAFKFTLQKQELERDIAERQAEIGFKNRKADKYIKILERIKDYEEQDAQGDLSTYGRDNLNNLREQAKEEYQDLLDRGVDIATVVKDVEEATIKINELKSKLKKIQEEEAQTIIAIGKQPKVQEVAIENNFTPVINQRATENVDFYQKRPLYQRIKTGEVSPHNPRLQVFKNEYLSEQEAQVFDQFITSKTLDGLSDEQNEILTTSMLKYKAFDEAQFGPNSVLYSKVSTKILEQLKNRDFVSKQYIIDLTKQTGIKQAEINAIQTALLDYDGGRVDVRAFTENVQANLLELTPKVLESTRYDEVNVDNNGKVKSYNEVIWEAPFETTLASQKHFDGDTNNYFAHERLETMESGIVRVIELQSDLMQKGTIKQEAGQWAVLRGEESINTVGQKEVDKRIEQRVKEMENAIPYKNTWYERIIRERIKQEADKGTIILQYPTGETAMGIEGLGRNYKPWSVVDGENLRREKLQIKDLEVGLFIADGSISEQWVITDVLGDGIFRALYKNNIIALLRGGLGIDITDMSIQDMISYAEQHAPDSLGTIIEQFDISGTVSTQNPIYKFYENEIYSFLSKIKPVERVTDAQGREWYQIELTESDTNPVVAFQKRQETHDTIFNAIRREPMSINDSLKMISSFGSRLGVNIPVLVVNEIQTGDGDTAAGAMFNNTIFLTQDHTTRTTPFHEMVHWFDAHWAQIEAFNNINKQEVYEILNNGPLSQNSDIRSQQIEVAKEKLAELGEQYFVKQETSNIPTLIQEVLEKLKMLISNMLRAVHLKKADPQDFLRAMTYARVAQNSVQEYKNNHLANFVLREHNNALVADFGLLERAQRGALAQTSDFADFVVGDVKTIQRLQAKEGQLDQRIQKRRETQPFVPEYEKDAALRKTGAENIIARLHTELNITLSLINKQERGEQLTINELEKIRRTPDRESVEVITRFIDSLSPVLMDDVSLSIRKLGGPQGQYNWTSNVIEVFTEVIAKGNTPFDRVVIHELWHHLSKYISPEQVAGMKKEYNKALNRYNKQHPWFKEFNAKGSLGKQEYADLLAKYPAFQKEIEYYTKPKELFGKIAAYTLVYDEKTYRYKNVDEWFAETMADNTYGHFASMDKQTQSIFAHVKNILRSMYDAIVEAFGFQRGQAIFAEFMDNKIAGHMVRSQPLEVSDQMILNYDPAKSPETYAFDNPVFQKFHDGLTSLGQLQEGEEFSMASTQIFNTKNDLNVFQQALYNSVEIFRADPVAFKVALEMEKAHDAYDTSKNLSDEQFSKILEPYFALPKNKGFKKAFVFADMKKSYAKIDKVLVEGDKDRVNYTEAQLKNKGLDEMEIKAYQGVRRAFDTAFNRVIEFMVEQGTSPEEIATFRKVQAGYIPHKWKYPYNVKVYDLSDKAREQGMDYKELHAQVRKGKPVQELVEEGMLRLSAKLDFKSMKLANQEAIKLNNEGTIAQSDKDAAIPVDFFSEQYVGIEKLKNITSQTDLAQEEKAKFIDAFRDMFKEKGFAQSYIARYGTKGYQQEALAPIFASYFSGMSGWMAKALKGKQYYGALELIDARKQPRLYKWATDLIRYDMGPNNDAGSNRWKKFAFTWMLANDIGYLLLNMTQNYTVGAAVFQTQLDGKANAAFTPEARLLKAVMDYNTGRTSALEKSIIQALLKRGRLGGEMTSEVMGFKNNPLYRSLNNGLAKGLYESTAFVERNINRVPAFIAAFRAYQEQGDEIGIATTKALDFADRVHFRATRHHRSELFRTTAAQTVFIFLTFSRGYFTVLAQLLGKKQYLAFTRSMVNTVIIGGTMSLPFAGLLGAMKFVLEHVFGADFPEDEEIKKEMSLIETLIKKGIPAAVAGADFSGRVGLEFFNINMILENPTDMRGYMGVLGSLVIPSTKDPYDGSRFQKAFMMFSQKRYLESMGYFLPDMFANPIKGYVGYTKGVTSLRGVELEDAQGEFYKYTPWEAFLKGLGISPTQERILWEARSKEFRLQSKDQRQVSKIQGEIRFLVQKGDIEQAKLVQEMARIQGIIGENTDYVKQYGMTRFLNTELERWEQSEQRTADKTAFEKNLIDTIYNGVATDNQINSIRREVEFYTTFGKNNDYANALKNAKNNAEKINTLLQIRGNVSAAEFNSFYSKARSQFRLESGNNTRLLISDQLHQSFEQVKNQSSSEAVETKTESEFIRELMVYAEAIKTDPITAFNRMLTNQKIRKVDNGTIIVERNTGTFGQNTGLSTAVRRSRGATESDNADHTIPLQLGGKDTASNIRIVSNAEWKRYTPIENYLGSLLRSGVINKKRAQELIVDFKDGKLTEADIYKIK